MQRTHGIHWRILRSDKVPSGFIHSCFLPLGLTIQRKSHLIAARQPIESRPAEWRQPLWLVGFAIFIVANIGGTIFQIGALPIVMLAPLGAVSLLYNALLAKFLLEDALGSTMVGGEKGAAEILPTR